MRRLSAILMIAALLAALVPSAVLAGKPPPPKVYGAVVTGDSPSATYPGDCGLRLVVTFEGRATYLKISNGTGLFGRGDWVVKLDRKAGYVVTYDYLPLSYLNGTVTWSLTLVDRKIQPVSPTQTVSETFGQPTPATECPAYMTEIVRWPAL